MSSGHASVPAYLPRRPVATQQPAPAVAVRCGGPVLPGNSSGLVQNPGTTLAHPPGGRPPRLVRAALRAVRRRRRLR